MLVEILEHAHSVEVLERRLPGPHAVKQGSAGRPQCFAPKQREGLQRIGGVAAERSGDRRQRKAPAGIFGEDTQAREGAEHPVERLGMHFSGSRQLARRARTRAEVVRDAEFGHHIYQLAHETAPDQLP